MGTPPTPSLPTYITQQLFWALKPLKCVIRPCTPGSLPRTLPLPGKYPAHTHCLPNKALYDPYRPHSPSTCWSEQPACPSLLGEFLSTLWDQLSNTFSKEPSLLS